MTLRVAIVGYGKIAQDQHAPAIAANADFELAAVVSPRSGGPPGVPCFADTAAMIAELKDLDAVAVCTPPTVRYGIARACLEAGLHTLLEKPPGVTLGEVDELARVAEEKKVSLYTTWHARHHPAVTAAAGQLAGRRISSMRITWHEDVRKWHPGQQWIWQPGGFGVFDPGINAFSIATFIFPGKLLVTEAELFFPENRQMPIAAELGFASPAADGPLACTLDWRHQGGECWDIHVEAEGRKLALTGGGSRLAIGGQEVSATGPGEYPDIYARFAELVAGRRSEVDVEPLRLAADTFMSARRTVVDPFND